MANISCEDKNYKVYHIMLMNILVADVYVDSNNRVIDIKKYVDDGPNQPFSGKNKSTERFFAFLEDRCYENGRKDLPKILASVGLKSNNPYEWVKITHGVTYEDFFWIKFDGEDINWEDVKVR